MNGQEIKKAALETADNVATLATGAAFAVTGGNPQEAFSAVKSVKLSLANKVAAVKGSGAKIKKTIQGTAKNTLTLATGAAFAVTGGNPQDAIGATEGAQQKLKETAEKIKGIGLSS
ncbi:MAG: hypothetical protein OXT65_11265 [Alphaproteobacteria bacterium]|nr:hypothetical protein [Alphaproteobacteria bacterium]